MTLSLSVKKGDVLREVTHTGDFGSSCDDERVRTREEFRAGCRLWRATDAAKNPESRKL